jgi:hypothetical protein
MPVLRRSLTTAEQDAIDAEGRALLKMAAAEASSYDVRFQTGR